MEYQPVELIGIVAVATMVGSYALEHRHPAFIGVFAGACWLAALYAVLIDAMPFVIAEGLWGLVALRRWRRALKRHRCPSSASHASGCDQRT